MKKNDIIFNVSDEIKSELEYWFRYNNLSREKMNLFYDFIISLNNTLEKTYLGSDVLFEENDIKGHFNWCWNNVINNFTKERIFFKDKGNHYDYFWQFYFDAYYLKKINEEEILLKEHFTRLFNFTIKKTPSELEILVTIYKIFNYNLKK